MRSSLLVSPFFLLSTSLVCFAPMQADTYNENTIEEETSLYKDQDIFINTIEDLLSNSESAASDADNMVDDQQAESVAAVETEPAAPVIRQKKPVSSKPCVQADQPYRVSVSHIESKGIGYQQGYTTLEGFFTGNMGQYVPFVDLRGHVFNNGKWASNVGIGTRYVIDPSAFMLGGNFYYDYRNTNHYHYNQIGLGFEAYLTRWEFRANGYLPVGKKRKTIDHDLNWISFKGFSEHNMLINENYTDKIEFAMRGFNAEVGVHPLDCMQSYDLFVGAGPYYFNADDGRTTWGGKVRVKAEVTKYVYVELSNSYDHVFHNRFQGTLTLSYPFGGKPCYRQRRESKNTQLADNIMYWRAVQPVERQEIIVTSKHKKTYTVDPIAKDPTTGQPYYVVFVNNANTNPAPNGTFENPFANLSVLDNPTFNAESASVAGNVIYVFAGTGDATNMDNGIILKNSQRFLGSATPHLFQTTKGLLNVPAQTTVFPHIQGNSAATRDGVVLADSNEVSGFDISFPGPIASTGRSCINGIAATGFTYINNNNVVNETTGILIGNAASPTAGSYFITNNTSGFHSDSMTATGFSIHVSGVQSGTVLIENNTVSNELGHGILVRGDGDVTGFLLNNVANNIASDCIVVISQSMLPFSGNTFFVKGNAISNTGGSPLALASSYPSMNPILDTFIVENNTIDTATVPSTITSGVNMAPGELCVRFNNNITTNGTNPAYTFGIINGGTMNLETPIDNVGGISVGSGVNIVVPCTCIPCESDL